MIQQKFILGDEWLYYKLYCGNKTADSILINIIKPLTEKLLDANLIKQWFFIRYADPDTHLRIRFHCEEISKISDIINEVKKAIGNFLDNDIIWKVQIDTYQREIERYGVDRILMSEKLFYLDSLACLEALELIDNDNILFMFALRSINDLFDAFSFNINDKISFTKENLGLFKEEFNSNKILNKQLNKKYQDLRIELVEFMELKDHKEYQSIINVLNIKNINLLKLINLSLKNRIGDGTEKENLISNYIHMMINRLFRDKQRLYELVCYDCLHRYFNYKLATNLIDKCQ